MNDLLPILLAALLLIAGAWPSRVEPPVPEPVPTPVVEPVVPVPVPASGFRVLFVFESTDRLTPEQLTILHSTKLRDVLVATCAKDGTRAGFRFWDKDTVTTNDTEFWRAAWDACKGMTDLPRVILFKGDKGTDLPLPETEAATIELIRKHGGAA